MNNSYYFIIMFCLSVLVYNFYKMSLSKVSIMILLDNLNLFFLGLKMNSWSKSMIKIINTIIITMMFLNFSSLFPYNFSINSQISSIFFFSLMVWIFINFFNFNRNFKKFYSHTIPEGSPLTLSVFLFLIENISNCIRPITLGVRMMANCISGHLLLILISNLVVNYQVLIIPTIMLMMVEVGVSLIQSYIIATLITLYYSEIYC